jgi:hypothetical protein
MGLESTGMGGSERLPMPQNPPMDQGLGWNAEDIRQTLKKTCAGGESGLECGEDLRG